MPYTTVVASTTITASWGNANVRDQVVTPFATSAARASAITSPIEGMLTWLADVNRLEVYDGAAWINASNGVSCVATRASGSTQSIPNNTNTTVTYPTETLDQFGGFAATSDTITVQIAGLYQISGGGSFAVSASGDRAVILARNGTGIAGGGNESKSGSGSGLVNASVADVCAVSDTITVIVFQNSGGALNIDNARLSVVRVGGTS